MFGHFYFCVSHPYFFGSPYFLVVPISFWYPGPHQNKKRILILETVILYQSDLFSLEIKPSSHAASPQQIDFNIFLLFSDGLSVLPLMAGLIDVLLLPIGSLLLQLPP